MTGFTGCVKAVDQKFMSLEPLYLEITHFIVNVDYKLRPFNGGTGLRFLRVNVCRTYDHEFIMQPLSHWKGKLFRLN